MQPTPTGASAGPARGSDAAAGTRLLSLLPGLVHDLRGPVTALTAFSALLEEGSEPAQRVYLDALGANAELITHVADCLAFLAAPGQRTGAPVSEVVLETASRWQKVLSRGHLTLNLSGVFPDTCVERRALRVVLVGLVLSLCQAAEGTAGGRITLSGSEAGGTVTLVLALSCQAGGTAVRDRMARLHARPGDPSREGDFADGMLAIALEELGGSLTSVEATVDGGTVALAVRTMGDRRT